MKKKPITHKFLGKHESGADVARHLTEIIEACRNTPEGLPSYLCIDEDSYRKLFQYAKETGGEPYKDMTVLSEFRGVGIVVVQDIQKFYSPACTELPVGNFGLPGTDFEEKIENQIKEEKISSQQQVLHHPLKLSLRSLLVALLQGLSYRLYVLEMIISGKYHLRGRKPKC